MSGHSKWATTHRQKAVVDAKRGRIDRCCGRLHCLLFAEFDFYAVCLFDYIHAFAGFGAHFVERVAGQNAAVHVKHGCIGGPSATCDTSVT